ncbi:hypothetical protein [Geodermatophilus sp. SYSU D01105]
MPGDPPLTVGPLLRQGEIHYRPFLIRCGELGCGDQVGEVLAAQEDWEGRPFIWAECWWITDRQARPARITRYSMILDSRTQDSLVDTECLTHGVVSVAVQHLLDRLPAALDRLVKKGRSTTVIARKAGAEAGPGR